MNLNKLYIGVMSGTSMDGVDTALVEIEDNRIRLIAHDDYPMPAHIKQTLLSVCTGQNTNLKAIGELDHQLGHLFADAVLQLLDKSGYSAEQIRAIGNHGQTVFHQPTGDLPFTTQLGDANIIAVKTGIDTVADFRRKDMALGGQGAPLVPAFHKDARFALQGNTDAALLTQLLAEPYLTMSAPKSTGRELFNIDWLHHQLTDHNTSTQDVQRTLCEYSAKTIASEVEKFTYGQQPQLLVCGGGARNPLLMQRLAELLPQWQVATTDDKGVDGDYMEAMAFAWLAQRHIDGLPSNLPEATGASRLASLGVLYPKN